MLQPYTLAAPGFNGLNTQLETQADSFEWASVADNCVYDTFGRISSRKGWTKLTTAALSGTPNIAKIFEYRIDGSNNKVISAANNKLYHGTTTLTDITGTLTPTGNNWNFQNFNGKVVAWQTGHTPIVWNNTGNFANIAVNSGTQPDGPACLSAFGRMWAFDDDRTTLRFSALLDETRWASADGGGSVDLKSNLAAAHSGIDFGVALAEFDGLLVVFMTRTILLYSSAQAPGSIALAGIIQGVGCAARDSVRHIGDDLLFLDRGGLMGLRRAMDSDNNLPLAYYSNNVRDKFLTEILATGEGEVHSAYSLTDGFYLITNNTFTWCFNTKNKLQDGTYRVTRWNGINPKSLFYASDNELYIGQAGVIGKYADFKDNTASYVMDYVSTWSSLGTDQTKLPKDLAVTIVHTSQYNVTLKLGLDYVSDEYNQTVASAVVAGNSEWNIMEWNIGQWGGASNISILRADLARDGHVVQIGLSVAINGASVAVRQIRLLLELGGLSK